MALRADSAVTSCEFAAKIVVEWNCGGRLGVL
jgi:hypothetical protein